MTKYIAEFVNTLTNLAYGESTCPEKVITHTHVTNPPCTVYYAFKSPSRPGQRGPILGMDAMAASLILIGIFSFLFHATLHRETQFLDEMSMFFLGASFLQPLYTTGFAPRAQTLITTVLLSVVVAVSAVYYQTRVVELHWGAFFIMENMIWPRALWLVYYKVDAAPGGGRPAGEEEEVARMRRLKGLFWSATLVMALALVLWTVDLTWCPPLRALREAVGQPWGVVLELHGWWHVLTAVAASRYIELIREICG